MNKFTFDSAALYTILLQAQAQLTQEARERTGDNDFNVQITYYGWSKDCQHFRLELNGKYGAEKARVEGKHLEQCLEEALRRLGFAEQQENLQLEHLQEAEYTEVPEPTVAEPVDLPSTSDEEAAEAIGVRHEAEDAREMTPDEILF